ncbi:MAG: hypothetical protein HZC25_09100 [Rhodospirillales bacterium]|nr:hypothetical protein [Rhodospirillales bacterium]
MRNPMPCTGLALVALLSACAPQPMISSEHIHSNVLIPSHFAYAARDGKVEVTLKGNPFAGSPEALAAATTRAMKDAHAGPRTQFVPRPATSQEIYRLVYLFNPDPFTLARKACENPDGVALRPAEGGTTRVFGIFCQRETPLSEAMAVMEGVTSADSPAFSELIAGLTLAILPYQMPDGGVFGEPS